MLAILAVISVCIVLVIYFNINKPSINNHPNTNQATTYVIKVAGNDNWNWDEIYLQEGIARVKKGDLYGFVDVSGKTICKPKYRDALVFSDGLAAVLADNLRWGFIDTKGEMVIPARFGFVSDFKNGVARIQSKGYWGAIDKSGKTIIPLKWSGIGTFIKTEKDNEELAPVSSGGLWGYINKDGEIVIKPQFLNATNFYKGLATVILNKNRCAIINTNGEILHEVTADFLAGFQDDYAIFFSEKEQAIGYIDMNGNVVIPPRYASGENYCDFVNGYAVVYNEENGYHIINKKGENVISIKGYYIGRISEGIALVLKDNKWGYVNVSLDKVICEPQWDAATIVNNGCAFVRKDGIWNIIEFRAK